MTVTATPYGPAVLALGTGGFNFSSDTLKCMLVGTGYTPDVDAHDFRNDVSSEVSGTGYTAGGATLSGVTWTYDTANNRAVLAASPLTWSTVTLTSVRYAVVYKSTGSSSTDRLLCYIDFGASQSPTGVDFTLDWSAGGVFRATIV